MSEVCHDGLFVLFKDTLYRVCWPIISEFQTLAAQYGGRASFLTLEQSNFPAITKAYDISIMPTTIYFQNGTHIATFVGHNRQGFKDFIEKYASAT